MLALGDYMLPEQSSTAGLRTEFGGHQEHVAINFLKYQANRPTGSPAISGTVGQLRAKMAKIPKRLPNAYCRPAVEDCK